MNIAAANRHVFYTLPVVLYACLILSLSSFSTFSTAFSPVLDFDRFLHFVEYTVFGYLIIRLPMTSPDPALPPRAVLITILAGAVFGVLDEFYQSFVPGRDASVYDALADLAGIVTAAFTYRIIRYKFSFVKIVEDRIENRFEKGFSHGQ